MIEITTLAPVSDVGVSPIATDHIGDARRALSADGAVILTGRGIEPRDAVAAAGELFGERVLAIPPAAEVRAGGVRDHAARRVSPEEALPVHTDGFGYGDHYPDYFLLLCATDSPVGGESILVDGYKILDSLATTTKGVALLERLTTVLVDQTEDDMRRSISPLVAWTPAGRRMVRRFPFQRPRAESTDPTADAELVATWDSLCRRAAQDAPRFRLEPGDVAIIDNYRVLHGREPYTDLRRLMWRVWVWTDASNGVPSGSLASDTRYAKVAVDAGTQRWSTITADSASAKPVLAVSPSAAATCLARDGAAVVEGIETTADAIAYARSVLGSRAIEVRSQFEATSACHLANQAKLADAKPDPRGRVRRFTPPEEVMVAHNDGYGFGDLAPDYIFLWCANPAEEGGASWLVDGAKLLETLKSDKTTATLASFCESRPIDHSEPGFPTLAPVPIARRVTDQRLQVRHNPYLAPCIGDEESADAPFVAGWCEAVEIARDRAHRLMLGPGQMLCVDNYRMLHGRDAYRGTERKVVAIWAWTTDAVAVPDYELSIV